MKPKKQGGLRANRQRRESILKKIGTAIFCIALLLTSVSSFDAVAAVTAHCTGIAAYIPHATSLLCWMPAVAMIQRDKDGGESGGDFDQKALLDKIKAETKALMESEGYAKSTAIQELNNRLAEIEKKAGEAKTTEELEKVKTEVVRIATEFKASQEKGTPTNGVKSLREYITENSEVLKTLKTKVKANEKNNLTHLSFSVETKATQGATDIGSRDYFGEIEPGIERKPVRAPRIMDLFRRKAVSTEYLHFWEENVVTRDAKFVIACATSTHLTKKTWQKRTVELAKIRDIVDICIDMLDDYAFVESEIRDLITESITLLADYELLHGLSAASTDLLSIDSISSEFNAANPLAPYSASFTTATIGDLIAAVAAQIYTFGQERAWAADTVLMNYNDMVKYLHAKDLNGNYQFPTFVFGATNIINGLRIVTSPIVAPNTLYVFDSTKGAILDRKMLTVNSYYENRDNAEHELVTFVGVERLQFHVRNINRDAFMKVSDVAAALAAITIV